MLFNVSQLLREHIGSSRSYTFDRESGATPPVLRGSATLIRTPDGVLVEASVDVVLEAECSRCLVPFGYPAHIEFDETYLQQYDVTTGARVEIESDDADAFVISANHTIDISEAVRQYSVTAAEMQPLCRPDCPGICPECGTDLTIANCRCDRTPTDSRWAALAALKRPTNG
jgi:uncharacterized protein